jgi:hypothetical protein
LEVRECLLSFDAEFFCLNIVLSINIKINIYRTVILPVLCGFETWSLAFREEHDMKVFDGRVLRKIF